MSMHAANGNLGQPPLLRALARPKVLALGCLAVLVACGWSYIGLILAGQNSQGILRALCAPVAGIASPGAVAVTFAMWCAMVLAMMLPTAGPMIVTYADLAETAAAKGEPAASPLVLTASYIIVWFGAALALTALQAMLARLGELGATMGVGNPFIAGAMFLAAGLYQFSSVKHACLTHCRHPFRFFFGNWTADPRGVFRIGLQQGLFCLGCCWAMMLLMLAVGTMNVVWMAILGAVMAIEKLGRRAWFSYAAGIAFIAIGLFIIVETSITGWPLPG